MAAKQEKVILKLYGETLKNDVEVPENEDRITILSKCKESGQFAFYVNSYWGFVKSTYKGIKCVRMVFALKNENDGKVHNITRVMDLVRDIEKNLIYVDNIFVEKDDNFIYIDMIKYL